MLRPYIDHESRLSAGSRGRPVLRTAAGPGARGRRPGGGARGAAPSAGDAGPHARARPPGAAGASGRVDERPRPPGGAGPHRGAGGDRGGRGGAPRCLRSGGRRRRGARSGLAGAAGRIAAVGGGRGAPPWRARPDSRFGRAGRPHRMTAGDDVQLVTFKVAGQEFAFNIFQVERILRYEAPAPLPKAPDFLEGVLQYQGTAIPLVDLRKRLGVPAPTLEESRRVSPEWEGGKLGVVVDAVTEVRQVAAEQITAPPGIVKGLAAAYITGLVVTDGRTIIVLNTARLLSSQEKVALEAAGPPQAKGGRAVFP